MVPLDRALVSCYRLSVVTMPLTEAVGRNSQCRYLGVQSVPPFVGMWDRMGSKLVPQGSGQATLFVSSDSFSV